jgi:WD40 repeat protein
MDTPLIHPNLIHVVVCPSSLNIAVQILASSSYDDTIKLYVDDPSEDWFCFNTLTGHTSTVWSLAWEPKGRYLASASDDRTVRIWKQLSDHRWICALLLENHERAVYSVSWTTGEGTKEGSFGWLASTGSDGTINVWELSVGSFTFFHRGTVSHRTFTGD